MPPVFLIGYMGSGKTTLGRGVEARTHISFIDLDDFIENRACKSISDIFKERGEQEFRMMEREALIELSGRDNILVACGGGTPCFYDNMDIMNRCGTTIWLQASIETLHRRLSEAKSGRPLIAALNDDELREFIISSLNKRIPYYTMAKHTFCADNLDTLSQLDTSLTNFISNFINPCHDQ